MPVITRPGPVSAPVPTSRPDLVIARTPDAVVAGELVFLEAARPGGAWATYSDVLDPEGCAAVDHEAYQRARTWYGAGIDGADPTDLHGASLGRAYELPATAMLVAMLRARTVLARMAGTPAGRILEVRGAGEEWAVAGSSLGMTIAPGSQVGRPLRSLIPDSGLRRPSHVARAAAAAFAVGGARSGELVLSESPRWVAPYHDALLDRWRALAINPGARLLRSALTRRRGLATTWLVDAPRAGGSMRATDLAELAHPFDAVLRASFILDWPRLAGWATLGRSFRARVAVAAQDVSPAVRAVLLGFRADGGRIVTLEHGISGSYAEQIHSVADLLGAWGPSQAAYHRTAGAPATEVVELGWPRLVAAAARAATADATLDVVFFGQPATPLSAGSWPEDALSAHAFLEAYAVGHPNRRVAVKHHPAAHHYHAPEIAHRRAVVTSGDSLSLIRKARVVAAATSTTALEAMAVGRPVIHLVGRGSIGPADLLLGSDAVVSVSDAEAFDRAAEELLSDPAAYRRAVERGREFASAFVTGLDRPGAAESGLVGLVERLLAR